MLPGACLRQRRNKVRFTRSSLTTYDDFGKKLQSVNATISIAPANFYKYVRLGKIRAYKTSIAQFIADGVELKSGDRIKADVVVFGTGFRIANIMEPLNPSAYENLKEELQLKRYSHSLEMPVKESAKILS